MILPRWLKILTGSLVLIIVAGMAFAIVQPITVLPRIRLAPGFGLTDQSGARFTSEQTRGTITVYNFSPLDCGDPCAVTAATMRDVRANVAAAADDTFADVDVRLVTIALDPNATPAQLTDAAGRTGADGETWRWVGGTDAQIENVVGIGFKRYVEVRPDGSIGFDPGFVIVDGWGVIRGDYRYQTLSDDADKLTRHLGLLATEIRYASGPGAIAYEAAHLFLCYP